MERFLGTSVLPEPLSGSVITVGNFDGVHRGHQAILRQVKDRAKVLGLPSVVYTFRPHPIKLLAPQVAPPLITSYAQKIALLESAGVDIVVEEPFTRSFAAYSPDRFVTTVIHEALGAKEVFAGYDFSFGRGGKATAHTLRELGAPYGIKVHIIDPLSFEGIVASSTKIREFVTEGRMQDARRLLGRHFSLSGPVVHGEQRGRKLGFPTANLEAEQELLPAHGVYACFAQLDTQTVPAVVNIGIRPTFGEGKATIEAHLLDFSGDLYGHTLSLDFVAHLRTEQPFSSVELLIEQIAQDIQRARSHLASDSR